MCVHTQTSSHVPQGQCVCFSFYTLCSCIFQSCFLWGCAGTLHLAAPCACLCVEECAWYTQISSHVGHVPQGQCICYSFYTLCPCIFAFAFSGAVRALCTLSSWHFFFFALFLHVAPSPAPPPSTSCCYLHACAVAERVSTGVSLTVCLSPPPQDPRPFQQRLDDSAHVCRPELLDVSIQSSQ